MDAAVVVTRPQPEATAWADALHARGHAAMALPLIDIGPPSDARPVQNAWERIASYRAALFVSGNAVGFFFKANQAIAPASIAQAAIELRAWAPGPQTAEALRQAGFPAWCIDAPPADAPQFDSETLWPLVRDQVREGDRILLVRGRSVSREVDLVRSAQRATGNGREWLAERVAERGGRMDAVAAYERRCPDWSADQRAQAEAARAAGARWLFSSSEAVANLKRLMPGASWRHAHALATHPRIADAAQAAGFAVVHITQPALAAVVASIESIR